MSKWIDFVFAGTSPSGKTRLWHVVPKDGGGIIGTVSWYAPWRKYVFEPHAKCVFEQDCLRDLANFVQTATHDHKQAQSLAKGV